VKGNRGWGPRSGSKKGMGDSRHWKAGSGREVQNTTYYVNPNVEAYAYDLQGVKTY